MRKTLYCLLMIATAIAAITPRAAAQYAFQDAQSLRKGVANVSADQKVHLSGVDAGIIKVLGAYVPPGDAGNTADIEDDFATNPFIAIDAARPAVEVRDEDQSEFGLFPPGGAGSLDVTTIANGVAALLVERAKQELTIAFFQRFQTFAASHKEFALLFPTTLTNLNKLLTFSYPQMLSVLRNGFFSDLKSLPDHLPGLLTMEPYTSLLKPYPEIRIAIRSLQVVANIQSGASNPAEAIHDFLGFPEWSQLGNSKLDNNIKATVLTADLISQSLRSSVNNQTWVSPKDLKPLLTDVPLQYLFFGLLWQSAQTQNITFYTGAADPGDPARVTDILAGLKRYDTLVTALITRVNQLVALAAQIQTGSNTIASNNSSGKANTNADYYNYIGVAVDFIDTAFGIVDMFYPGLNAKPYLDLARTGNAIYKDIYSQQYTQAINDGMDFVGELGHLAGISTTVPAPAPAPVAPAAADQANSGAPPPASDSAIKAELKAAKKLAKATAKQKSNAIQQLSAFVEKVKPLVLFMSNLLEANSSADVQAALDNAILPVGSSSIKKNTKNNLAVQAYLGAYAMLGPTNPSATGIWSDRYGVTAPIGLSYTPGWLSWGSGGSISVFLEVFDLGAIVDYQLKTDTVASGAGTPTTALTKSYSVQLGQIFSPGAYLVYGSAGNLPLAFGIGRQYGPGLSSINTTTKTTTVTNPTWRWTAFLTVDLPLFNIWNVTRRKKH